MHNTTRLLATNPVQRLYVHLLARSLACLLALALELKAGRITLTLVAILFSLARV